MNPADIVAAGGFFAILIVGLIVRQVRQMRRDRPQARIRSRVMVLHDERRAARHAKSSPVVHQLFSRELREHGALRTWIDARRERLRVVGGRGGVRVIAFAFVFASAAALIGTSLAHLPGWARALIDVAAPLAATRFAYNRLTARFKQRFLSAFPDALDLIIRAVRAGIPVTQAIATAGIETDEPVRTTFRTMGDSLRVGAELKEVLEQAAERLQIADFSFFSVCLILQRETGGNLSETLENLSAIIRTRRDIRLKTRALTAEGRISTNLISAMPFAIAGMLYMINRAYISLLFDTHAGHKILSLAAVLMAIGLVSVRKIANLNTSR
ncbi:type II secretion system F family protein [Burkholderia guangdongensis]|uniref:type II secretion system F family protein n=1 Tax=Burkholderia guangdongensis TaxID=1792500 RepID=UPI0015CD7315|nr:type II secretion system F family protein [Burkholderia guangdongensis]